VKFQVTSKGLKRLIVHGVTKDSLRPAEVPCYHKGSSGAPRNPEGAKKAPENPRGILEDTRCHFGASMGPFGALGSIKEHHHFLDP
jgi:hypothetical protein